MWDPSPNTATPASSNYYNTKQQSQCSHDSHSEWENVPYCRPWRTQHTANKLNLSFKVLIAYKIHWNLLALRYRNKSKLHGLPLLWNTHLCAIYTSLYIYFTQMCFITRFCVYITSRWHYINNNIHHITIWKHHVACWLMHQAGTPVAEIQLLIALLGQAFFSKFLGVQHLCTQQHLSLPLFLMFVVVSLPGGTAPCEQWRALQLLCFRYLSAELMITMN